MSPAIGKRNVSSFLRRVTEKASYAAFANMLRVYEDPLAVLYREVLSSGEYPFELRLRTPIGSRNIRLHHYEDLSTLNLIFCRQDYIAPSELKVAVDIGSNIGISALFWLTRNRGCRAYLYEPVATNAERLETNLAGFEDRYSLETVAVSNARGQTEFGIEPTGKHGGIGVCTGTNTVVNCIHIMDVIEPALNKHGVIDCLKIDTEGKEVETLDAVAADCWKFIRCLNVDSDMIPRSIPSFFEISRRGSAMRYKNIHFY